jgi:hypothetical protein
VIASFQYKLNASEGYKVFDKDVWTLQYSNKSVADDTPAIVPVEKDPKKIVITRSVLGVIFRYVGRGGGGRNSQGLTHILRCLKKAETSDCNKALRICFR